MDVCCDILVPRLRDLPGLTPLVERTEAYAYGDSELRRRPIPAHVLMRLPDELRAGLASYSVTGRGLDLLSAEVNGEEPDRDPRTVEALLDGELDDAEPWAFVFEWRCSEIDETVAVASRAELVALLRRKLLWETESKGFIAYHLPPR